MIRRGAGRKSVDQSRIGASAITWLERELHVHPLFLFARFTPSLSLFSYLARSIEQISIPNIANRVHHRECKGRNQGEKNINQKRSEHISHRSSSKLIVETESNSFFEKKKKEFGYSSLLLFYEWMNYAGKE